MAQRIAAFLLIATQSVTLGYFSETLVFPICAAAAAVVGAVSKLRLRMSRREAFYLHAGIVAVFLAKHFLAPLELHWTMSFLGTSEAYAIGQAMIVFQILCLFRRAQMRGVGADPLPLWLPELGVVAMVCFGDLRVTSSGRDMFLICAIAFACCCAVYYSSSRPLIGRTSRPRLAMRFALRGGVLLVAAGLAWGAATLLYRFERQIDEFLQRFYGPMAYRSVMGFSGTARLNSILARKGADEDSVVLQVFSAQSPGYLRGSVFDTLGRSEWHTSSTSRELTPVDVNRIHDSKPGARTQLVSLDPTIPVAQCRELTCWPDRSLASRYFVPLGTVHCETSIEEVFANAHGILTSAGDHPGHPYSAFVNSSGREAGTLATVDRSRLTQIPDGLDPRVRELATRILADKHSAQEKVAAILDYFRANYEYAWGIEVPAGEDPLTYFLLQRPAAHCEYFASGAAVLLRLGGVPCRYVTGFVAVERNTFGGYWVARNRDAHAWVEAYDEASGWVTVDATPAAGVPAARSVSRFRQWWEFARISWQRVRIQLQRDGLRPLMLRLFAFLSSWPVLIVLGIAAMLRGLVVWVRHRRQFRAQTDPLLMELHRLLHQMDKRLARHDLHREAGETLSHFADRISETSIPVGDVRRLADWYRLYVSLRFSGPLSRDAVEALRRAAMRCFALI